MKAKTKAAAAVPSSRAQAPTAVPFTTPDRGRVEAFAKPEDTLSQIEALMEKLKEERSQLVERLNRVDKLLGTETAAPGSMYPSRPKNAQSLKEVVLGILTKPMTKNELLEEIAKTDYKFSGRSARNSLNVLLYTKKNGFRKTPDGKFLRPD